MDDLISRAAAIRIIVDMHGLCRNDVLRESIQAIKELPAVDAAPVVHAQWVISPGCLWPIGDCSVCGEQHIGTNDAKYCPHCGARMDGEADG